MDKNFEINSENGRIVLDAEKILAVKYKIVEKTKAMNFYFTTSRGERYYFKMNSLHTLDKPELLSSWLAEAYGLDVVKMFPAEFHENDNVVYGILSKDYVKKRNLTEVFTAKFLIDREYCVKERINTLWHHLDSLKKWCETVNNYYRVENLKIAPGTDAKLKKQMLWYYLVANQDAHANNIEYQVIYDPKTKSRYVHLSPIFDNSYSFFMRSFRYALSDNFNKLSREEKEKEIQRALSSVYATFQLQKTSLGKVNREAMAIEIAQLMKIDKDFKTFYEQIKNTDARKIIEEKIAETNCKIITENDIELVELVIKGSINAIEKAIEYEKMVSKSPMRFLTKPLNPNDFTLTE